MFTTIHILFFLHEWTFSYLNFPLSSLQFNKPKIKKFKYSIICTKKYYLNKLKKYVILIICIRYLIFLMLFYKNIKFKTYYNVE
jgi:hypothetical protein